MLVVAQDLEAVEDGQGVVHDLAHDAGMGAAEDAAGLEIEGYRRLGDAVALVVGDGEDLEVESEALDEHAVKRVGERFAAEQLDARLRVADGQADQDLHQAVVDGTDDLALPGIVQHGVGMPLGADDHVGLFPAHDFEEPDDLLRRQIEVRVQQQNVVAAAGFEPGPQGGAFAGVGVQVDGVNLAEGVRRTCDLLAGPVRAAVVDDNDFKGDPIQEYVSHADEVVADAGLQPVGRHDNAQPAVPDALARGFPGAVRDGSGRGFERVVGFGRLHRDAV